MLTPSLQAKMLKPDEKPSSYRRVFYAVGAVLCLLVLVLLCNPIPLIFDSARVIFLRSMLPAAVETWTASAPSNYRVHVKGAVPLSCFIDAELTVRDGKLTEVQARENPLIPDSALIKVNEKDWNTLGCSFEDLTVEGMFQRVDQQLNNANLLGLPLTVRFDKQLGYITQYRFGRASGGGLLSPTTSECCIWFEYDRFLELPP